MPEIEEVTAAPAVAEAPKKQSNVEKQLAAMRAAMAADAEKQRIEDAKPKGKAVPGRYDEQGYSVAESLKNVTTDEDGYGVFPEDDEFDEEGAKEFVDPRWEMSMQQLRDSYVETLKGRDDTVGEHSGKPDANYVQNDPIYVAAARGEVDNLKALLKAKDLDTKDLEWECPYDCYHDEHSAKMGVSTQQTPLWIACYNGHPECVELLLKAGANANATTIGGSTPLEVATNCCHQKCVELLLAAKPDDVVPSYVAATYNKREALSTLLGAELDRRGVAKPEVKPKKYGGYGGEKIELVYG